MSTPLGELNRDYWNANAADVFKQQWVVDLSQQITDSIQSHVEWIGVAALTSNAPITMLDYACGNGLASMVGKILRAELVTLVTKGYKALAQYVSRIRDIDVSDGMVERYNAAARKQRLSEDQMYAVQGNLMVEPDQAPEALKRDDYYNFDVIVMSVALHHIEDPRLMITRLVERLRDGGSVLIVDWASSSRPNLTTETYGQVNKEQTRHGEYQQDLKQTEETVSSPGFDEEAMSKIFQEAGCSEWEYSFHKELSKLPAKFGGEKQLFFARGKK